MAWHWKDPTTFSARFPAAMREAAAALGEPILLTTSLSSSEIYGFATRFRWYRWCLRHRPGVQETLAVLDMTYSYRTQIIKHPFGYELFLTAKPTQLSEFFELNPDLAIEIETLCQ